MSLRTATASLLILATATSASAADDYWLQEDLPFVDIRLGYGLLPIPGSYKVDVVDYPPAAPFQGVENNTMDTDAAHALSYSIVGGRMDPIGPLFGGELVYTWATQRLQARELDGVPQPIPADSASLQYRTFGGNVLAGAGWALTRNLHVEGLGVLGIGGLDLDFPNGAGNGQNDGEGWYWNAGVRGGIYFTWRKLVIGALCEYTRMAYKAESNWFASNTSVDDSVSGIGWRMEIGYHIQ